MSKKISAALFLILLMFFSSSARSAEEYDPQHTMLALNMAIVSVHRILATQDRLILDQEYQNIMNNLSIGNIRSDSDITQLYDKLIDIVTRKKLREDEIKNVQSLYDIQTENRLTKALADVAKSSAMLIEFGDFSNADGFFKSVGSLLTACTASYFKFQTGVTDIRTNLEENLYRLKAEEMVDFSDMQKQLLSSSWNLMNLYHLPDEFRLVQKAMDDFYRAVEEPDTASRRLRMLRALEDDFKVYPPYWFYRARTAQEAGDTNEAEKCFDKFDEVWRPVLRRDPYKLEVVKHRIIELVKDGAPKDDETKQKILELAGVMRENTLREDWANNLFAGALYYSLGEKETAIKCVEINLDFNYETELSTAMLSQIKNNVLPSILAQDTLRALNLNRLIADMKDENKESALLVADYFDEREGAVEALKKENKNPLVLHALRIIEFEKADPSAFKNIYDLTNKEIISKDNIPETYMGVVPMVKTYADVGNIHAQIFMADMYNYGWGVPKSVNQAMNYYAKAGDKKNLYSQFIYFQLMISREDYSASAKIQTEEKKEPVQSLDEQQDNEPWWKMFPYVQ